MAVEDEKLAQAATLVAASTVANKCGLAEVLTELAQLSCPPLDVTTWLCARLKSFQPKVPIDYPEPVLKDLVMKCDEFENIHVLPTERPHQEVWNFRKTEADGLAVFGSGQCHVNGLLHLAKHLHKQGYQKVLWFNMREEPVVFLDGQACAPRAAQNLNENIEYLTSILGAELDSMESRLRADCIAAASASEGQRLGVFYQTAAGGNLEKRLAVPPETTHSVRAAYQWINQQDEVAQIKYSRVPIADETAPEEQDFDQLVRELKTTVCASKSDDTALVFNCQMGRGRTTTGMVCGSILLLAARGWRYPRPGVDAGKAALPEPTSTKRNLKRGEYKSILELLRLIDGASLSAAAAAAGMQTEGRGLQAKMLTDQCCDDCAHAQHMVEAIVGCSESGKKSEPGAARSPEFWARRAINYLERYAYLLLFAAYALEEVHGKFERSFTEWSHQHWQFKRIIKHLSLD